MFLPHFLRTLRLPCPVLVVFLVLSSAGLPALAVPGSEPQPAWGLAIGLRYADIPYRSEDKKVADVIPQMFFHGEHLYLHGMEAGVHLWQAPGRHQVTALGRHRFFDIPKEYQNQIQEDRFDLGLRYRYIPKSGSFVDAELLSDGDGRPYGHLRLGTHYARGKLELWPSVQLDWRSSDFNSRYYGLNLLETDSDVGLTGNFSMRYHLASNLYLVGEIEGSRFGRELANLPTLDQRTAWETYLGIAFFPTLQQRRAPLSPEAFEGHYLRVAHGWATPSRMGEIFMFDREKDVYNNQLTSAFYGYPLTDSLFGQPIALYLTPGVVYHHRSKVQDPILEGVVAIKAYYTFNWPIRWRVGAAEGVSYVSNITYIEQDSMDEKGYRPSKLMNYLDVSLDVNLGDLLGNKALENAWVGYSLHHRSSIFESASQFGRIKGGSNYNTIYLQWHF